MKTSVIGFPRVGKLRELKFATEKYFRGEITAEKLEETAKNIRKEQWLLQKENQIDYIPSGDFSYYDTVLDTAVLLHVVPQEYEKLKLSALDTYFAMARGYQEANGDVKALAMKKWFNTNYHYLVPEFEDETKVELTGTKPFDEYLEAEAEGIVTKPVLLGPFTFLKLARYCGKKQAEDFSDDIAQASRSDLLILDALKTNHFRTEVGTGVYDIHSPRVPSVDEIVTALNKMIMKVSPKKLWINPDCGLKTRGTKETEASLINLLNAAKKFREEYKKTQKA